MHLERLVLEQFRTYEQLDLSIPAPGLRISGRNASGKTSVLEALVMLSTTRSSRASADRDVVRWDSGSEYGVPPYARLLAELTTSAGPRSVGISLELDPVTEGVARKQFLVNGESVRAHDLVGVLACVLFSPEDVFLVSGPPSERRRQFDILLSQIDRGYLRALSQYGKVLGQRNQLLKRFAKERRAPRDLGANAELTFWDEELIALGARVMVHRLRASATVSTLVQERAPILIDGADIGFAYRPRLELPHLAPDDAIDRMQQETARHFQTAIEDARGEEFRRGMTIVGPHRDDYQFTIHGRDLAQFGSRGQQRLGVVAYRMAEMDIIGRMTGEQPVLLLDDVLSELDGVHRDLVISEVAACGCQLLVTSTDAELLDHPKLASLSEVEIRQGSLVAP